MCTEPDGLHLHFIQLQTVTWTHVTIRGRHGNGNRGNNRGNEDKLREQSGNTAVMGFRIVGNTAMDVATGEAFPNKTA